MPDLAALEVVVDPRKAEDGAKRAVSAIKSTGMAAEKMAETVRKAIDSVAKDLQGIARTLGVSPQEINRVASNLARNFENAGKRELTKASRNVGKTVAENLTQGIDNTRAVEAGKKLTSAIAMGMRGNITQIKQETIKTLDIVASNLRGTGKIRQSAKEVSDQVSSALKEIVPGTRRTIQQIVSEFGAINALTDDVSQLRAVFANLLGENALEELNKDSNGLEVSMRTLLSRFKEVRNEVNKISDKEIFTGQRSEEVKTLRSTLKILSDALIFLSKRIDLVGENPIFSNRVLSNLDDVTASVNRGRKALNAVNFDLDKLGETASLNLLNAQLEELFDTGKVKSFEAAVRSAANQINKIRLESTAERRRGGRGSLGTETPILQGRFEQIFPRLDPASVDKAEQEAKAAAMDVGRAIAAGLESERDTIRAISESINREFIKNVADERMAREAAMKAAEAVTEELREAAPAARAAGEKITDSLQAGLDVTEVQSAANKLRTEFTRSLQATDFIPDSLKNKIRQDFEEALNFGLDPGALRRIEANLRELEDRLQLGSIDTRKLELFEDKIREVAEALRFSAGEFRLLQQLTVEGVEDDSINTFKRALGGAAATIKRLREETIDLQQEEGLSKAAEGAERLNNELNRLGSAEPVQLLRGEVRDTDQRLQDLLVTFRRLNEQIQALETTTDQSFFDPVALENTRITLQQTAAQIRDLAAESVKGSEATENLLTPNTIRALSIASDEARKLEASVKKLNNEVGLGREELAVFNVAIRNSFDQDSPRRFANATKRAKEEVDKIIDAARAGRAESILKNVFGRPQEIQENTDRIKTAVQDVSKTVREQEELKKQIIQQATAEVLTQVISAAEQEKSVRIRNAQQIAQQVMAAREQEVSAARQGNAMVIAEVRKRQQAEEEASNDTENFARNAAQAFAIFDQAISKTFNELGKLRRQFPVLDGRIVNTVMEIREFRKEFEAAVEGGPDSIRAIERAVDRLSDSLRRANETNRTFRRNFGPEGPGAPPPGPPGTPGPRRQPLLLEQQTESARNLEAFERLVAQATVRLRTSREEAEKFERAARNAFNEKVIPARLFDEFRRALEIGREAVAAFRQDGAKLGDVFDSARAETLAFREAIAGVAPNVNILRNQFNTTEEAMNNFSDAVDNLNGKQRILIPQFSESRRNLFQFEDALVRIRATSDDSADALNAFVVASRRAFDPRTADNLRAINEAFKEGARARRVVIEQEMELERAIRNRAQEQERASRATPVVGLPLGQAAGRGVDALERQLRAFAGRSQGIFGDLANVAAERLNSLRRPIVQIGSRIEDAFDRGRRSADRFGNRATSELRDVDRAARRTGQSLGALTFFGATGITGIATTLGLREFIRETVNVGNAFQTIRSGLQAVFKDSDLAASQIEFLVDTSRRLGANIRNTAPEFTKFAAAGRQAGLSTSDLRDSFTGVLEASRVFNLSAQRTGLVFNALTQILSKGRLQSEELRRQLGDSLPGAFEIAAKSLGVTTAELNDQLKKGLVDSRTFILAFIPALRKEIEAGLPLALNTVQAQFTRFITNIQVTLNQVAQGGFFQGLTDAFRDLNKLFTGDQIAGSAKRLGQILGDLVTGAGQTVVELFQALSNNADTLFKAVETIGGALNTLGKIFAVIANNSGLLEIALLAIVGIPLVATLVLFGNAIKGVIKFFIDLAGKIQIAKANLMQFNAEAARTSATTGGLQRRLGGFGGIVGGVTGKLGGAATALGGVAIAAQVLQGPLEKTISSFDKTESAAGAVAKGFADTLPQAAGAAALAFAAVPGPVGAALAVIAGGAVLIEGIFDKLNQRLLTVNANLKKVADEANRNLMTLRAANKEVVQDLENANKQEQRIRQETIDTLKAQEDAIQSLRDTDLETRARLSAELGDPFAEQEESTRKAIQAIRDEQKALVELKKSREEINKITEATIQTLSKEGVEVEINGKKYKSNQLTQEQILDVAGKQAKALIAHNVAIDERLGLGEEAIRNEQKLLELAKEQEATEQRRNAAREAGQILQQSADPTTRAEGGALILAVEQAETLERLEDLENNIQAQLKRGIGNREQNLLLIEQINRARLEVERQTAVELEALAEQEAITEAKRANAIAQSRREVESARLGGISGELEARAADPRFGGSLERTREVAQARADIQIEQNRLSIEQQLADLEIAERERILEAMRTGEDLEQVERQFQLQRSAIVQESINNLNEIERSRVEESKSAATKALEEIAQQAGDFDALAGGAIESAFSSAEDAIVSFVRTGKLEFSGLIDSILEDLTRLATKQLLGNLAQGLLGGGGLGGLFGGGGGGGGGGLGGFGQLGASAIGAVGGGGGGGGGGFFGSILSGFSGGGGLFGGGGGFLGLFNQGGIAGVDSVQRAHVPAIMFANAQRFQFGGMVRPFSVGGPDRVPALLSPGEAVLTPAQLRAVTENQAQQPVNVNNVINVTTPNAESFSSRRSQEQVTSAVATSTQRALTRNNLALTQGAR